MSPNVSVNNANSQTEEDQENSLQQNQYTCSSCKGLTFSTCRGLSQYTQFCAKRVNIVSISSSQPVAIFDRTKVTKLFSSVTLFMWGERDGTFFTGDLNETYEKIFFWRENFLTLPIGNLGKKIYQRSH